MKAILVRALAQKATFTALWQRILVLSHKNNSVIEDCTRINLNRIFYLAAVAAPMRILDIILFADAIGTSGTWGKGIMICHGALFLFYLGVFLLAARLRKNHQTGITSRIMEYAVPTVVLVSGIVIVTIDQLTTTSITPLLIVCVVSGIVFLIRPLASIVLYLGAYFLYYYLIALTITDANVLLSNRVNGATAMALGLLISMMSWHYNYVNLTQKRKIDSQQGQLERMAYKDSLTNLYNRHYFNETIQNELSAVQRYGHESVIILLDIDCHCTVMDTTVL